MLLAFLMPLLSILSIMLRLKPRCRTSLLVSCLLQVVLQDVKHHRELAEQHHPVATRLELGQQPVKHSQLA